MIIHYIMKKNYFAVFSSPLLFFFFYIKSQVQIGFLLQIAISVNFSTSFRKIAPLLTYKTQKFAFIAINVDGLFGTSHYFLHFEPSKYTCTLFIFRHNKYKKDYISCHWSNISLETFWFFIYPSGNWYCNNFPFIRSLPLLKND